MIVGVISSWLTLTSHRNSSYCYYKLASDIVEETVTRQSRTCYAALEFFCHHRIQDYSTVLILLSAVMLTLV